MMKRIILSLAAACLVCCTWAHSMTPRDISEDPVVIMAPDTFINKAPISFTDQGVAINVSSCSAYNAQHSYNNLGITYFACLANATMTISAQTPIQGIAVNGWVRKNFSASCDYGTIDYLSDSYDDTTGEPVLTISARFPPHHPLSPSNLAVQFGRCPSNQALRFTRFIA